MPELPEVETIRRQLSEHVRGRTITDVEVLDPLLVDPLDPRDFEQRVMGRSISALERTGKYLFVELDHGEALALHLRMTGQLLWSPAEPDEAVPHARAVFRIGHHLRRRAAVRQGLAAAPGSCRP
jgi:formamidopyrimidine-DNA glycosylase